MSILIWANAGDAGYPAFSNGKQLILPDPRDHALPFNFTIDEVLYQRPGVRSRNTWVARLTTQNFSAPGEAPRVATTVDEGQQSKDDVQLSYSGPGPSNPRRKSVRNLLSAKAIWSTGNDTDKPKNQKRKLETATVEPGMLDTLIHALRADCITKFASITNFVNHDRSYGRLVEKLRQGGDHLRLFLKHRGRLRAESRSRRTSFNRWMARSEPPNISIVLNHSIPNKRLSPTSRSSPRTRRLSLAFGMCSPRTFRMQRKSDIWCSRCLKRKANNSPMLKLRRIL